MDTPPTPNITSFVIRFVHHLNPSGEAALPCRGTIHNVQTNEEIAFAHWDDAVAFIQRYVAIIELDVSQAKKRNKLNEKPGTA
jgi:hypothetical protein